MRTVAALVFAAASCGTPTNAAPAATEPAAPSTVWSGAMNLPPPLTVDTTTTHALRGPNVQLTEPPPAPPTTTIPLEPCDELRWYRTAAGLPARFDAIGYRESRCGNTAISRTGCCVGWWQIHWVNFDDHRTIDGLQACDATWTNIRGDTPEAKTRQACAAKVLYDIVAYQPWATS
jgi:hypothetical protein